VLKDANHVRVESVLQLLSEEDDYLISLGYQLLTRSTGQVEALLDYLISESEINQDTLAAARVVATLDLSNDRSVIKSVVERGGRQMAYVLRNAIDRGRPSDEVCEYIDLLREFCERNDIDTIPVFSEVIRLLLSHLLSNLNEGNVNTTYFSVFEEIWHVENLRLWTMRELSEQVDALCDYLTSQGEVNQNTAGVARMVAALDWQTLVKFPTHIQVESLQEWFARMWVVCGSALCFRLAQSRTDF